MKVHAVIRLAVIAMLACGCSEDRKPPEKPRTTPAEAGRNSGAVTTPPSTPTTRLATKPATTPAPAPKVVEVSTPEQLIAAIGPDRVIKLAPGQYDLTEPPQRYLKHVYWRQVHDGYELVIRNVKGLRLEGTGGSKAHLITNTVYAYVLAFEDVAGIELVNLELGHAPEQGGCTGGVVRVERGRNVAVSDCVLYGCGTEGLTLKEVTGMKMVGSTIKDCTYGIMTAKQCQDLLFKGSHFVNNKEFHGIVVSGSLRVKFQDCRIEKNAVGGAFASEAWLFGVTSSSDVEVVGGSIRENRFSRLLCLPNSVKFDGVTIADNMLVEQE